MGDILKKKNEKIKNNEVYYVIYKMYVWGYESMILLCGKKTIF